MKTLRYLNVILTILTVLAAWQLWTVWAVPAPGTFGTPGTLLSTASAAAAAPPFNPLDAGAQQQEVIAQLKQLNQKVEELQGLFKSGQARVRVEAAPAADK